MLKQLTLKPCILKQSTMILVFVKLNYFVLELLVYSAGTLVHYVAWQAGMLHEKRFVYNQLCLS